MMRFSAGLLVTASSLLFLTDSALAQDEPPTSVETVVVTAEKRTEKLQAVPETVSYVSPKQLMQQSITTTSGLVKAAPSLTVTSEGAFQIRSIGTQGFGRSAEQSVSVVVDGVVIGRPLAYTLTNQLYDLDHVEVLPGPQGTLFGNNADAGVINIVTKAPELGETSVEGHAEFATHDFIDTHLTLNVPIGDDAALRLSYHHDATGDVVYNTLFHKWDYNREDGVRARLLWEPLSELTINLIADYQKVGSNGVNGIADFAGVAVFSSAPPGSPLAATLAGCGITASPNNNRVCSNSLYAAGVALGDTYGGQRGGASLQVDYGLGDYQLTSITALRIDDTGDLNVHADLAGAFGDSLPQNILDRNLVPSEVRTFSEEFRVQSPSEDPFNFVAGLYFGTTLNHDLIDQAGQFGLPLGALEFRRLDDVKSNLTNYAAFGQANYSINEKLQIFAGVRVTHDNLRDFSINLFPDASPAGPYLYTANTGFFSLFPINTCTLAGGNPDVPGSCPAGTSLNEPAKLSTTGVTWKVGAKYQVNPDIMVFSTLTKGYKGPFLNDQATWPILQSQLVVRPEDPLDLELGVKSTVFDTFAIDASLFWDKIRNFQTTEYVPANAIDPVPSFIQGNAPHAITQGVDISFFGTLTDDLSLSGGLLYDDAHFNKGFLALCATGPCDAIDQMPYAPKWKTTLAGEFKHHLFGDIDGFLQSDLVYSTAYPYNSAPPGPFSGDRVLLGARLGVRSTDGSWSVGVFCRNCFDNRYPVQAGPDGFSSSDGGSGPPQAQVQFLSIDSYRLVGITLDGRI